MQVIFQTKSKTQNRYTIHNVDNFGKVYFPKGVKVTTDKDLIKTLLNHPLYERGDYEMVSNEELVGKYLDGVEPDKLTKETLDSLSMQGVKELGKVLKTKSEQPTLIKVEAEGKPITNKVQEVLDFYSMKDEEKEEVKEPEEFVAKTSGDMSAQDAIEYIVTTDASNLKGFLSEDEERKTVLKAWKEKIED